MKANLETLSAMKTLIASFFMVTSCLAADSYRLAFKRGQVEVFRQGKLQTSDEVLAGDEVRVGAQSLALLKAAGESIKILENTILIPREYKKSATTLIELKRGSIVNQVKGKKFRVRSKDVMFGVRGTSFFVHAQGESDVWMCVQEGMVDVAAEKGKVTSVPAGKGVFIKGKTITKPKPFAWTREINWNQDPATGELQFKPKLDGVYDLNGEFYD